MSSPSDFLNDLTMGAASFREAATNLAAIAKELGVGFTSQQVFDPSELRTIARRGDTLWINSPATDTAYGVRLDLPSLTNSSIEGTILRLGRIHIPPESRKRLSLTNQGGYIRLRILF